MAKIEKIDLAAQDEPACLCSAPKHQKQRQEKKPVNKVLVFSIAIVAIFLASFFTFRLLKQPETINAGNAVLTIYSDTYYTYNNFEFRYSDHLWLTEIYDSSAETVYRVPLHYGPKDLLDIEVDKAMISFLGEMKSFRGPGNKPAVFVTYDPEENSSSVTLSYYELSQNLRDTFGIKTLPTVTKDVSSVENETIKTCNSLEPVIYLRHVSPAFIDYTKNCLIIQGKEDDLIKAVDRALLQLYGVMI